MPPPFGHPQSCTQRARLRGLPEDRFDLGPLAPVQDVRPRRLLRQLAEPPRHPALSRVPSSDHRGLRPARRMGLVLCRRGHDRPRRRHDCADGAYPALRLTAEFVALALPGVPLSASSRSALLAVLLLLLTAACGDSTPEKPAPKVAV